MRVGLASFTPEQLAANIEAMMAAFVAKFVGWRNVKSVHIKGPNTMALPIWLAQELWLDEGMVLEEEEVKDLQMKAAQKGKRERKLVQGEKAGEPEAELKPKRKRVDGEDEMSYEPRQKKASKVKDGDLSQEMSKRREKLRQPKDASGGPVVENALRSKFLSEDSRKVKTSKKNIAAV